MISALKPFAGLLLFAGLVLTVSNEFFNISSKWIEGSLIWLAGSVLYFDLAPRQRRIILLVGLCALVSWLVVAQAGDVSQVSGALTMNQSLIVMLMGVHFLQLVATPKSQFGETLPVGKSAFLRTYSGVHLFGSVINLSSVMLVADRLVLAGPLTKQQQILLTRAFSTAASWSPFFAAFAAAMVFAPGASIAIVMAAGLTLACIAFFVTFFEVLKLDNDALNEFVGYPMHFQALWLPAVLAILVMVGHESMPAVKVIILIALFAVLISAVVLSVRFGLIKAGKDFQRHVTTELPRMKNEILLFLVAGVFGAGLAAVLKSWSISVPFEQFDGVVACITMLSMFVLAIVGVHPVVSIAVIGSWISSTEPDQTLLAMTFLMSWALGVSTSPVSGLNLALHGRYGVSGQAIFQWNFPYALKMYCAGSAILLASSYFLGI